VELLTRPTVGSIPTINDTRPSLLLTTKRKNLHYYRNEMRYEVGLCCPTPQKVLLGPRVSGSPRATKRKGTRMRAVYLPVFRPSNEGGICLTVARQLNRRPPERERELTRVVDGGDGGGGLGRAAVAGSGRPGRAAEMVSRSGPSVAAGRERGRRGSGPVRKIVCGSVSKILFGTEYIFFIYGAL
jgi:hypothetical protein